MRNNKKLRREIYTYCNYNFTIKCSPLRKKLEMILILTISRKYFVANKTEKIVQINILDRELHR